MCLWNLSEEVKRDYRGQNWGWKVFNQSRETGELFSATFNNFKPKTTGIWLNEKTCRTPSITEKDGMLRCEDDLDILYKTGWHIYLEKKHAEKNIENDQYVSKENSYAVIRKVFFKNPVAWGNQGINEEEQFFPVVVAKDMMIENDASVA